MQDSYKDQDGCYNCRHCHIEATYDDPTHYYCEVEAKKPLQTIEEFYNEHHWEFSAEEIKEYDNLYEAWHKFWDNNEVKAHGICDSHKKGDLCQMN